MARTAAHHPRAKSAARPIWRGNITFGLVQVPVVLQSAETRKELKFNLLDSRDHARIRYQRINESTGEEVPWDRIVKAYEYSDSNYVELTDEDFKRAAVKATKSVEIEQFVDEREISPLYYETPYYLVPDKNGDKGYALLREALLKTKKVGVARVVIRTREYLSVLRADKLCLELLVLRFNQELRETPANLPSLKEARVHSKELDMAVTLVDSMAGEWKPESYHDQYSEELMKWIEKKAKSGGVMPPAAEEEEEAPAGRIINFAELLQKSLKQKGASRPEGRSRKAAPRRRTAG